MILPDGNVFVYVCAIFEYILEYWFKVESGKNLDQLL